MTQTACAFDSERLACRLVVLLDAGADATHNPPVYHMLPVAAATKFPRRVAGNVNSALKALRLELYACLDDALASFQEERKPAAQLQTHF